MAGFVGARLFPDKRNRPSGFQNALLHFVNRFKPLFACRGFKLRHRYQFSLQIVGLHLPVFD